MARSAPRWPWRSYCAIGALAALAACAGPPPSAPAASEAPTVAAAPTAAPAPSSAASPTAAAPGAGAAAATPLPGSVEAGPEVTLQIERAAVPMGPAGAWDSGLMDPGAMVIHDGVFHMLYNAVADFPAPIAVGYASSADGRTWTREAAAPVLTVADIPWQPAPAQLRATSVLVEDNVWVLYFTATDDTRRLRGQIGRATAPSPLGPWAVDPEPVLAPGPAGSWDAAGICCAKVVRAGGGYRMYYSSVGSIGVAESPDGVSWSRGQPLQLTNSFEDPSVQPLGDGWLMVYKAYDGLRRATSADGLSWQPAPDRRLIERLPVGDIIYSNLLVHEGRAWLYFEAGGRRTSVYMATWPEP